MPIYMDLHVVPGVKAKEAAEAHRQDILLEEAHQCKCMTYWIDEARGHVFCLIDAPDQQSVQNMHNEAHGLVPHRIIEVHTSLVASFLGRVNDPDDAPKGEDGLLYINDPSFRVLLVTSLPDRALLTHLWGRDLCNERRQKHNEVMRRAAQAYQGLEAESKDTGFIFSFRTAAQALQCTRQISAELEDTCWQEAGLTLALVAGEPVSNNDNLFGETIQLGQRLCLAGAGKPMHISAAVAALLDKDLHKTESTIWTEADEQWITDLFQILDIHFADETFTIEALGRKLALSKASLYRKCTSLSGQSPNNLLKAYRLKKAKEEMRRQQQNISQIAFLSGFGSHSYFTRCFKESYGMLPLAYLQALD